MKKIILLMSIITSMAILTACTSNNNQNNIPSQQNQPQQNQPQPNQPQQNQQLSKEPKVELLSEEGNIKHFKMTLPDGRIEQYTQEQSNDENGNHIINEKFDDGREINVIIKKLPNNQEETTVTIKEADGKLHKFIDLVKINPDNSRELITHQKII